MARQLEAMSCGDVLERLEAYIDGDLSTTEAANVEAHLEGAGGSLGGGQTRGCPACAAEHRLALAVRRELRSLPELDAPEATLREIAMAAERARFRGPTRRRFWAGLAAAVLAATVLGGGLWWRAWSRAPVVEQAAVADPARVARATEEARYALAYLTRIHRRAGLKLRDDLFIDRVARPTARGLSLSLSRRLDKTPAAEGTRDRS